MLKQAECVVYVNLSSDLFFRRAPNKMASHCNFHMHFYKRLWSKSFKSKSQLMSNVFKQKWIDSLFERTNWNWERERNCVQKCPFFRCIISHSLALKRTHTDIYHPHLRIHAFGFSPNSSYMHVCLDSRWISWVSYQFAWWWRHQSQRRFSSFSHFACFIYFSLCRARSFSSSLETISLSSPNNVFFLFFSCFLYFFLLLLACLHARTARWAYMYVCVSECMYARCDMDAFILNEKICTFLLHTCVFFTALTSLVASNHLLHRRHHHHHHDHHCVFLLRKNRFSSLHFSMYYWIINFCWMCMERGCVCVHIFGWMR